MKPLTRLKSVPQDRRALNWECIKQFLETARVVRLVHRRLSPKAGTVGEVARAMIPEAVDETATGLKRLATRLLLRVIDIHAATAPDPDYF